jgi:hypothetical protein
MFTGKKIERRINSMESRNVLFLCLILAACSSTIELEPHIQQEVDKWDIQVTKELQQFNDTINDTEGIAFLVINTTCYRSEYNILPIVGQELRYDQFKTKSVMQNDKKYLMDLVVMHDGETVYCMYYSNKEFTPNSFALTNKQITT